METLDIKHIWEKAKSADMPGKNYSLEDIRRYRRNKSYQTSKSGRWSILFDICLKSVITLELVFLLIFLNDQTFFKLIIGSIICATLLLILMDFRFLKKLSNLMETDSVIESLKQKLHYFITSYKNFILISALSSPLFVLAGSFLYYYFKYNEIRLESPIADPVPYLFLVIAFVISFFSQKPVYKRQLKEIKESIEDMDDSLLASIKIEESRKNRRRSIIIFVILILLGLLFLLLLLLY